MSLLTLIEIGGLLAIYLVIFAESGLFFGFFFPGDSLLFTAGLLAAEGHFSIIALIIGCSLAAIVGDSVGYSFGKIVGPKIFTRNNSLFFNQDYPERAALFYKKYGSKAIILARFVPVVRTFVPIIAGVGTMPYQTFLTYNIIGGIVWTCLISLLGYFLGATIPNIDHYILPIVILIIIISVLPIIFEYLRTKNTIK